MLEWANTSPVFIRWQFVKTVNIIYNRALLIYFKQRNSGHFTFIFLCNHIDYTASNLSVQKSNTFFNPDPDNKHETNAYIIPDSQDSSDFH